MVNLTKWALAYLKQGYSIIPVGVDKKPLVNWKPYQHKRLTKQEVREHFSDPKAVGIAVVTGKLSNLAVLDFEKDANIPFSKLKTGIQAQSGGGGVHFYYKYPKNFDLFSCTRLLPEMDLRGEGGYIILPPSSHKSGNRYKWIHRIFDYELSEFPGWMVPIYRERRSVGQNIEDVVKGMGQGTRNESATVVAGTLMRFIPYSYWSVLVWPLLVAWNEKNEPPMSLVELRHVYKSISSRAIKNPIQQMFRKKGIK